MIDTNPSIARLMRHPFLWNLGGNLLAESLPPLAENGRLLVLDPWQLSSLQLGGEASLTQQLADMNPARLIETWQGNTSAPVWHKQDCCLAPFPALNLPVAAKNRWQHLRQYFAPEVDHAPQVLISHAVVLAVLHHQAGQGEWIGQAASMEPTGWIETLTQANFQTLGMRIEEVECHYRRPANLWRDVNLYVPDHALCTNTRQAFREFWHHTVDADGVLAMRYGLWVALVKPTTTEAQEKVVEFQKKTIHRS